MTRLSLLACALVGLAGCASTDEAKAPFPMASATVGQGPGYLPEDTHRRLGEAVPPAPVTGSVEDRADRAQSDRYRALEGGDRWMLATAHAEVRAPYAFAHFDCALDTRLNERSRPALQAMFDKVSFDAEAASRTAQARLDRPRPGVADGHRVVCQRVSDAQLRTPSHPSSSAAVAAAYAEVLAHLIPDRAEAVRTSGEQIALSRAICGINSLRDTEDGAGLGRAVAAAILATPGFRSNAEAARNELAQARDEGLTHPACAAERAALAQPLP